MVVVNVSIIVADIIVVSVFIIVHIALALWRCCCCHWLRVGFSTQLQCFLLPFAGLLFQRWPSSPRRCSLLVRSGIRWFGGSGVRWLGSVASLQRSCSQSTASLGLNIIAMRCYCFSRWAAVSACECVCVCEWVSVWLFFASGGYLSRGERIAVAILHGILCLHSTVSLCCQISWCILHCFWVFLHFFAVWGFFRVQRFFSFRWWSLIFAEFKGFFGRRVGSLGRRYDNKTLVDSWSDGLRFAAALLSIFSLVFLFFF